MALLPQAKNAFRAGHNKPNIVNESFEIVFLGEEDDGNMTDGDIKIRWRGSGLSRETERPWPRVQRESMRLV